MVLHSSKTEPVVQDQVILTTTRVDNTGGSKGQIAVGFFVVMNDALGEAQVLKVSDAGTARWRPKQAGDWLIMAPPVDDKSDVPLTFKITVRAAQDEAAQGQRP
ncbi:MAG TPA: hypothetical protein DCQ06_06370 [Myxococcales bacterium]|nr:hypothetical protein [Myxococcales bacterium]HAN31207.1 hypothetical protein [Myxococcales bacterium]